MCKSGIVDVDVYRSTTLKEGRSQDEIDEVFNAYHTLVEEAVQGCSGEIWHRMGDGAICIFPTTPQAVNACLRLLERLTAFNKKNEDRLRDAPLFVRIGIHQIDRQAVANIPKDARGKRAHEALDTAGKLQKLCPIGRICISPEVYGDLELLKRLFRPALVQLDGKRVFVLMDRPVMPQEERLLAGLLEKQKIAIPPIPFTSWNKVTPSEQMDLTTLDEVVRQPLLLIFGETSPESRGPMSSAATSDAVGIAEVMAAMKSHREVRAAIDEWQDTGDVVQERNVIIVGSGIVNTYAFAVNDLVHPVHFVKTGGRVLNQIVATSKEGAVYFGPHASPPPDSALMAICRSPFNRDRILLWVAGITGMGTQAVATFLKDLIMDAPSTLRRMQVPESAQPIACVVGPETGGTEDGWKLSDYTHGRWRLSDYKVVWMVDRSGSRIL